MSVYRPELDQRPTSPPRLRFARHDFNQDYSGNNTLAVEYRALSFGSEAAVRFRTRLVGFDCAVAYHNRREIPDSPYRYAASAVELAGSVDVLVAATAGGPDTRQLVDRRVLEALGPQGYLINIARGSVVDEDALIDLLRSGGLAGAGLDVFAHEPQVPAALCELDNVVLLPHVGSNTARARTAMAQLALRNVDEWLTDRRLVTPVT